MYLVIIKTGYNSAEYTITRTPQNQPDNQLIAKLDFNLETFYYVSEKLYNFDIIIVLTRKSLKYKATFF